MLRVVCAWCLDEITPGDEPTSHGICERCSAEQFPETPTFTEEVNPMKVYLIWSFEHHQWWAANRRGYVSTVVAAGRYTPDDVAEIMANDVMREEIPVEEAYAKDNAWPASSKAKEMEKVADNIRVLDAEPQSDFEKYATTVRDAGKAIEKTRTLDSDLREDR